MSIAWNSQTPSVEIDPNTLFEHLSRELVPNLN